MNLAGSKALVVGILAVGAALSSAAADAPRAEPSVKERGLALYADVLGSLDELDRRAATLDHDARAAVVGMWSEHKLQAALDPYSLALFQEGRQRFDPLVSTMREATLEAGYQDRMGIAAARDIDTARITYERGRKRLVAEFGAMRELLKIAGDAEEADPRVRASLKRHAAASVEALAAMAALPVRVRAIVIEHRASWDRTRGAIERAEPPQAERASLAPATERAYVAMREAAIALDAQHRAAVDQAQRSSQELFATLESMRQRLAGLAADASR